LNGEQDNTRLDPHPIVTAWCVITGPPSAGKTSVLEALAAQGQRIVAETARAHIATLGKTPEQIAADRALQVEIQHAIVQRQQGVENALPPPSTVFLDRALPDSLAYFRRLRLPETELIRRATTYRYRHVFYLEGLPLERDGLRYEDDGEARALGEQIHAAYLSLGYVPTRVPAFADLPISQAIARRVALMLAQLV
jgi:predicted ATPase